MCLRVEKADEVVEWVVHKDSPCDNDA